MSAFPGFRRYPGVSGFSSIPEFLNFEFTVLEILGIDNLKSIYLLFDCSLISITCSMGIVSNFVESFCFKICNRVYRKHKSIISFCVIFEYMYIGVIMKHLKFQNSHLPLACFQFSNFRPMLLQPF